MCKTWAHLPLAITTFALIAFTYGIPARDEVFKHENSLFVQEVLRLAKTAEMRTYMNENVDPCDDFYEFACGSWDKINPAYEKDSASTGTLEVMSKALERKIANLLNNEDDSLDTKIDTKVKDFFASCKQMGKLKDNSESYRNKLLEIVDEFGGMPAISGDNWNEHKFDWLETVAKIAKKYGKNIILDLTIMADFQNSSVNRLYISHQDFPLVTRDMYANASNDIYLNALKSGYATELQEHLKLSQQQANKTANEIVDFEAALAVGMEDAKKSADITEICELTTVENLNQKYEGAIDVWNLVTIRFGEQVQAPVYECVSEYQRNLIEVLNVTQKSTVANYIMFSLLQNFWLETADTRAQQEKDCLKVTKKYFAKNLDNMIYRRYNNYATERDINMIWRELKQTFREELQSNKLFWMTDTVRKSAIEKLDAMNLEINSYTKDNFTEEFGSLVIDREDHMKNIKNILKHSSRKTIAKLHQKPKPMEDGEKFSYTPVNIIFENLIKVPIMMLQPYYLWADSYPSALKFGTLGALIGHELIHSFDDIGRNYDARGNSVNWWDDQSTDSFNERRQCFVDQYSKYIYEGLPLPRSELQSENIADNGGIRLAYQSFLKYLENVNETDDEFYLETLPKLNFTSKQLFFISFAQFWCNDVHQSIRQFRLSTDVHTPGKFRVIGPLSNFPEFSTEFNCGKSALMNRKKRCEIY